MEAMVGKQQGLEVALAGMVTGCPLSCDGMCVVRCFPSRAGRWSARLPSSLLPRCAHCQPRCFTWFQFSTREEPFLGILGKEPFPA